MSTYLNVNVLLIELIDYCKTNNIAVLPKVVIVKTYENGIHKIVFHNHRFILESEEPEGRVVKSTIFGTGL